jgi:hypothetical protein
MRSGVFRTESRATNVKLALRGRLDRRETERSNSADLNAFMHGLSDRMG